MSDITFTIITVIKNAENLILETLSSILCQSYPHYEYIIVDGCSADSTITIVNDVLSRVAINSKVISEEDSGIYDAMNKGVRAASGQYTIFINAGDKLYSSDTLLKVVEKITHNELQDVLFGDSFASYINSEIFLKAGTVNNLLCGMQFSHQSTFVATCLLKKYPFNLDYVISSDFDFLLNLYERGYKFLNLQMPIATTLHGGVSDSKRITTYFEYLKIINKNGLKLIRSFFIILNIISYILKKPIKLFISPTQLKFYKKLFYKK